MFKNRTWVMGMAIVAAMTASAVAYPPVGHGTLVTNDDSPNITDAEFAATLEAFLGRPGAGYESAIMAFTECYGGDMFDDFAGYSNTALLAASMPGNTSEYGGYHRGLAQNLMFGLASDAVHGLACGSARPGDSPIHAGDNITVGGSNSTHVLVWAGDPGGPDWDDIDDIHNNFGGAPNTTVTVLAGDGSGPGADLPATRAGLYAALSYLKLLMNPNEQLIFVGTDHGGYEQGDSNLTFTPGTNTVTTDVLALPAMLNDPGNQAQLVVSSTTALDPISFGPWMVNAHVVASMGTGYQKDYDHDGVPEEYCYAMNVDENCLNAAGNTISVTYNGTGSVTLSEVVIDTGAIAKTPEPASLLALICGLPTILRRRR